MARVKSAQTDLAKLKREREVLAAQSAELEAREATLKVELAREGAARLALAFTGLDFGEFGKAQATRFARVVASRGLVETLALLEAK